MADSKTTIVVQIDFNPETRAFLDGLLAALVGFADDMKAANDSTVDGEVAAEKKPAAKKKSTKKSKASTKKKASTAKDAEEDVVEISEEALKASLQQAKALVGMGPLKELITSYGVERASLIPKEKRAEFVAALGALKPADEDGDLL